MLATLTEKGQKSIVDAMTLNTKRMEKAFADLSRDELAQIRTLLRRMRDGFVNTSQEDAG